MIVVLFYTTVFFGEMFLFSSTLSLPMKFLVNIAIVNICLLGIYYCFYKQLDMRFPLLLTILVACFGPFGVGLFLMILVLYQIYCRTSLGLKALLSSLLPEAHFSPSERVYDRIVHGLDDYDPDIQPLPFMDIIMFGTEKQKRLAIEKILRYFHPDFAPALLRGLKDPNNGIRVLAATAVTTLDQRYFDRFLELEENCRNKPNHMKGILEFAEHCDQYALSQILDRERAEKMIAYAIESYEMYLTLNPQNNEVIGALGRLYIKEGKPGKAKDLLEKALDKSEHIPMEFTKWYMCALYNLKDYTTLRAFATRQTDLIQERGIDHPMQDILSSWARPFVYAEGKHG